MYEVKILAYNAQNKAVESVKTALVALKCLGLNFPKKPNRIHIILELLKTKIAFSGKKIEELADLPEITDQYKLAMIKILDIVAFSVYSTDSELYALMTFKRVRICLRYGNSMWSSSVYGSYGIVNVSVLEDFNTGYKLGKLSLSLLEKYNKRKYVSQTLVKYNGVMRQFKEHVHMSIKPLLKSYYLGIECGEFEWAGVAIAGYFLNLILSGKNLFEILKKLNTYSDSILRLNNKKASYLHSIESQAVINLLKVNKNNCDLIGKFFKKNIVLLELIEIDERLIISHLYTYKLLLCCVFNDSIKGKTIGEKAIRFLDGSRGQISVPVTHFCNSLINLSIYNNELSTKQKIQIIKQVKKHLKKLKKYARHAPMNHLHKYYLVKAELFRVQGKDIKAIELYDKAIELAKENEYIHEEAMAAERAALFWLEKENTDIAALYMNRAYDRYKHWGANNKLRDLEEKYPDLLYQNNKSNYNHFATVSEATTLSNHNVLDLSTVFKASQAISNEIVLKNLIPKLLTIVIENAGSEKGILILNEDDSFIVSSQIFVAYENGKEQIRQINDNIPLEQCNDLSEAIILYAARSLQNIVLENASQEGMFVNDPYVKQHTLKSILCTPIIYHGELTGLIYLENNKTFSAFTPERVEMVTMISSQAAISIENAKLFSNLEESAEIVKVAEKKYRGIFENAVEGIFQSTPEGRFLDANPSMAKILGFESAEEMISQDTNVALQCYANPEDRNTFIEILLNEGRVIGMEGEYLRKDNIKGWGTISARAVYDEHGNTQYYEGTLTDITERKEKESAERSREIAEASKEKIMDSIRYAQIIQKSLLPDIEHRKQFIPNSFILYQPKDIVGGDIYFTDISKDYFIIAVIDFTGHGVPGAFMTMIAISALRRIVTDEKCYDPGLILKRLNFAVKSTLQQITDKANSDDGMDVCICAINQSKTELTYSGAMIPLIYINNNKVYFIKGDRQSIGYKESKRSRMNYDFTNHTISMKEGMSFYLASDGYKDQLGGESISCFGNKRFKHLLKEITCLPFDQQKEKLLKIFHDYREENDIQDDLTVVGFGL